FQAEDGIRDFHVTGVQTCALPISIQPTEEPATWMVRSGRPRMTAALANWMTRSGPIQPAAALANRTAHPGRPRTAAEPATWMERSEERRVGKEGSARESAHVCSRR